MGKTTSIEWTKGQDGSEGATWTPIRAINVKTGKKGWHCQHAGPGCIHCYAEASNKWIGTGFDFRSAYLDNGDVELYLDTGILQQPTTWDAPTNIFVCSMTDLFGDFVTVEWIDDIFAVMALCWNRHSFDILTKRHANLIRYLSDAETPKRIAARAAHFAGRSVKVPWPMPHVRVGVSIEDQRRADERFPFICTAGDLGWNTMVSCEPLLEEVRIPERYLALGKRAWVVVGFESGRGARQGAIRNIRVIIRDCFARCPVFVKQLGVRPLEGDVLIGEGGRKTVIGAKEMALVHAKGGDPEEWPQDVRVQQVPER